MEDHLRIVGYLGYSNGTLSISFWKNGDSQATVKQCSFCKPLKDQNDKVGLGCLILHPTQNVLVVGDWSGLLRCFAFPGGKLLGSSALFCQGVGNRLSKVPSMASTSIHCMIFNKSGSLLFVGGADGNILLFSIN